MTTYQLIIHDRKYTSWEVIETINSTKVELNIDPINCKLFTNDIFTFDNNCKAQVLNSLTRESSQIPGVLILCGNKTYGRQEQQRSKKQFLIGGKLLYKCIPHDLNLPPFLVPYEIKNMGFCKVFKNLFVTFSFDKWEDKHPRAKLDNVIGSVDVLENFYEYQLFCKKIKISTQQFKKDTFKAIENKSSDMFIEIIKTKYNSIQDRTNQSIWHVITIDPHKCKDFDDGFSVVNLDDGIQQLSIYISNVTIWIDVLNLWDSFTRKISTIYLPDKKHSMLPTVLSDGFCSLLENVTRVAFVMDIFTKNNDIIDVKYGNCFINVFKNYCYEEPSLIYDTKYQQIFNIANKLSINNNSYVNNIKNSHDVVSSLMILMNFYCAKEFVKFKTGILRSTIIKKELLTIPESVPEEVSQFISIFNSASGQYVDGSTNINTRHDNLNLEAYVHITSPIRRIVDFLNMIQIQQVLNIIQFSENVNNFYNKWIQDIDYINKTTRSIKKVQVDCLLLNMCQTNPKLLDSVFDGYVFDKIIKSDGLYKFTVFLPELNLSSRITTCNDIQMLTCQKFKLFLFKDEENFKRKIRLQIYS
jgi:exoribonuclease R